MENMSKISKTEANAAMASSAVTSFNSLPDELALMILNMTAWSVSADDYEK